MIFMQLSKTVHENYANVKTNEMKFSAKINYDMDT